MLELTSTTTQVLFWVVAAVAFGCLVIMWDRLAGRRWWKPLARAGSLALIMMLTVLAAGVSLNKTYGWYSNWSDLFSTGAPKAEQLTAGGSAESDPPAPAPTATAAPPPAPTYPANSALGISEQPPAEGQWLELPFTGPQSGYASTVRVWIPASYVDPARANSRYPVIMAFHGFPGQPVDLQNGVELDKHVRAAAQAGTMAESIIVAPNIGLGNVDTECVNGPAGQPQVETFIATDVRDWLLKNFRVTSDRSGWATYGYSGGGYCASMFTMLHPQQYSAAINMAGYTRPVFSGAYNPFAPGSAEYDRYDLLKVAKEAPPAVAMRLQTSKTDSITWGPTRDLLAVAKPPLAVTAQVFENVGHRFSVWSADTPSALQWLVGVASGFAPVK